MAEIPYEYYIDIVTKRYFDGVDKQNLQQVLDCFHEDAVLTEVTSMTVHEGRDAGISTMFQGLFAAHDRIWHGNFVHTADTESEAICSQFSVEVTSGRTRLFTLRKLQPFLPEGRQVRASFCLHERRKSAQVSSR